MPGGAGDESCVPPGWSYNPSAWRERVPLLGLSLAGLIIAIYLALYQTGVISDVWDPFFDGGSRAVLHSAVSRLLPVPDAAVGAFAYVVDLVTGSIGGHCRWRTMPWIAILFGLAVAGFGVVSTVLVISQPIIAHAWCTLCLASALISIVLAGPGLTELVATVRHVRRGSTSRPHVYRRPDWRATWPAVVSTLAGVWLIFASLVLGYAGIARIGDRIIGPLVASAAIVSIWPATRWLRWVDLALGLCLLFAPWILGYRRAALINSLLMGVVLIALAGKRRG